MDVLFVTHSYPRHEGDAAGGFVLRLAQALGKVGVRVRVLAPSAPGLAPRDEIGGIPVYRFRYAPAGMETLAYTGTMAEAVRGSLGGKLALAGMLAAGARAVGQARRRFNPAVVHAHWWFPNGLFARGAAATTPFVITMHGSDVRLAARSAAGRSLMRRVLARADAVSAVSTWLVQQAAAVNPGLYCEVAPMPVDVSAFPVSTFAERRTRHVVFVGRLSEQKGILDAIRAVAGSGPSTTLDVVGDGPMAAEARALVERLKLSVRIRFLGALPPAALPAIYRTATAVIMPSREEGLGLVAVEANLSGAPVVAYQSGGLPDIVKENETGRLVSTGDVEALARALTEVLDDPERARRMGLQGRGTALAGFSGDAAASRYRALYEQAIATHGRRRR